MKRRAKRRMLVIALLIIVLGGGGYYYFNREDLNAPVDPNAQAQLYIVTSGTTPAVVAADLKAMKVIRSADHLTELFISNNGSLYGDVTYSVSGAMTTQEIYKILTSPTSNTTSTNNLLIFEGDELEKVAAKLAKILDKDSDEIIAYWDNKDNLKKWISQYEILTDDILNNEIIHPLEGYLYPATYPYTDSTTLESMTEDILKTANTYYGKYFNEKAPNGLSFHEALTLASIVERESLHAVDRPKIAQVFYNRLYKPNDQISSKLVQSDITVLYAMGEHKELVTYEDLKYDSPYNTYIYPGLPPGPIASPSVSAMDAVYNPDDNNYYFFFATQDTGEVLYSETLAEHEKVSEENAWS